MTPTFKIYLGDSKRMYLKVINAVCQGWIGDPVDLSDCTEIVINLLKADGTIAQLKFSDDDVQITDPAVLGKFSALIDADLSALLNVGEFQNVDVTFTIGSQVFTVAFQQALSVYEVA